MDYKKTPLERLKHLISEDMDALEHKKRIMASQKRGSDVYRKAAHEASEIIARIRAMQDALKERMK